MRPRACYIRWFLGGFALFEMIFVGFLWKISWVFLGFLVFFRCFWVFLGFLVISGGFLGGFLDDLGQLPGS